VAIDQDRRPDRLDFSKPVSRRTALGLGASMAAVVFLPGCGSSSSSGGQSGPTGTLRIARPLGGGDSNAASLYPASPNNIFETVRAIYDHLARPDNRTNQPVPHLAESWESDATARRWTVRLRDDAKFHDGKAVTAEDVAYTFQQLLNPDLGSPSGALLSGLVDPDGITAKDTRTVVFNMKKPDADLPALFLPEHCGIIQAGTIDSVGKSGLGSGPFKVDEFEPGSNLRVVVSANDAYWGGKPALKQIIYTSLQDPQARQNALVGGEVDMLFYDNLTYQAAARLAKQKHIVIQDGVSGFWQSISMKTDSKPFNDPRVRQAFKLAVDPDALIQGVLGGKGVPANDSPVMPGDPVRTPFKRSQDLEAARSLLKAAGYGDGLQVDFYTSDISTVTVPLAVSYQAMVKEAGITVDLKQTAPDSYWDQAYGKHPLYSDYFNQYPADAILSLVFRPGGSWNSTAYDNPKLTKALDAARAETDEARRREKYIEAQHIVVEDAPNVIPFFQNRLRAVSTRVTGLTAGEDIPDWTKISVKA
jgi:peptide/nickel transport system substrate-binding protein